MNKKPLRERPWYPNAIALCIAAAVFAALMHFEAVLGAVGSFFSFFSPVVVGCLIAYIMAPLAKLYRRSIFRGIKKIKIRATLANALTIITVLLFILFMLLVTLPQLIESVSTFAGNINGYVAALDELMNRWQIFEKLGLTDTSLEETFANLMKTASNFILNNLNNIANSTVSAGKGFFQFVIGFILSIYMLGEKHALKGGLRRLMKALFKPSAYGSVVSYLHRCDDILSRYIIFNLLDSLIVGLVNALFMIMAGMPYRGLVSFVVAITNLLPTFGPIIGGAVGAFVLVLVKPWYALAFLIFTMVLQTCDGYILKPRLFGNSLGVSGLWILVGVIVGGRIFGAVGVLAAIPVVAILDFTWRELFMPWLENRRTAKDAMPLPDPGEEAPDEKDVIPPEGIPQG